MKNLYLAVVLSMLALGKACAMEVEKQISPQMSAQGKFVYHLAQLEYAYQHNLPVTKEMLENVAGPKAETTDWTALVGVLEKYHDVIVQRAQAVLDQPGEVSATAKRNVVWALRLLKMAEPYVETFSKNTRSLYGEREANLEKALMNKPFYFP